MNKSIDSKLKALIKDYLENGSIAIAYGIRSFDELIIKKNYKH